MQGVLTAEQRAKVGALKDDRKEQRAESLAERIAQLEGLDLTEAETAKIAKAREQIRPKLAKVREALQGMLSDDQKAARAQALEAGKAPPVVLEATHEKSLEFVPIETLQSFALGSVNRG